jgi:trigger factor
VRTKVEELPESRVRLEVEVPESDVAHAIEHAASDLAESIKVPGFRKGKVPLPVVVARVGRDAVWQEAVRSHLDSWFWNAAVSSGIRPVANPDVELGEPPEDDGSFRFTATVAVMPKPSVPDWSGLEVGAADAEVPAEAVEAELEALRSSVAELVPVEDRPVQPGDTVVLDLEGEEAGTQRDYVVEVGAERLVDEIEEALVGLSAGESRSVEFELADGRKSSVELTVKEIKEKVLPELDDELARAASEFETLAELRADLEQRLREQLEEELEARFREAALDAVVGQTPIEAKEIEPLVERRAAELVNALVRSLERRGIPVDVYLTTTGQSQEQIVERLRTEAERAVRRELVLDAVASLRGLEVSDDEVEALVHEQAGSLGDEPEAAVALMREQGGFDQLRADLRMRKALDEIVSGVKRIPIDLARAREQLWTPEKEKGGQEMKIWTPGSKEAK